MHEARPSIIVAVSPTDEVILSLSLLTSMLWEIMDPSWPYPVILWSDNAFVCLVYAKQCSCMKSINELFCHVIILQRHAFL
jgi:hypothetical protein